LVDYDEEGYLLQVNKISYHFSFSMRRIQLTKLFSKIDFH